MSLGLRYRMLESQLGTQARNWSDHQEMVKLRMKLDPAARISLSAVVANGDSFIAGWNLRGLGGQSPNRMFLKQLFVTAKPRNGIAFQYGGLPIARGESSEITSYDNDGYLMGERVTLTPSRGVDELTATAAYLGDLKKPSVTRRFRRLSDINYVQVLAKRQLTDRLSASADVTDLDGERTLRQGLAIRPAKLVDLVRLEAYQRVSRSRAAGGAITVEKPFGSTRLGVSFASVDDHYSPLNADRYGRGRRLSFTSTTAIGRDVSLQVFVTRAFDDLVMPNRLRLDVQIRYELGAILRQLRGE